MDGVAAKIDAGVAAVPHMFNFVVQHSPLGCLGIFPLGQDQEQAMNAREVELEERKDEESKN